LVKVQPETCTIDNLFMRDYLPAETQCIEYAGWNN